MVLMVEIGVFMWFLYGIKIHPVGFLMLEIDTSLSEANRCGMEDQLSIVFFCNGRVRLVMAFEQNVKLLVGN